MSHYGEPPQDPNNPTDPYGQQPQYGQPGQAGIPYGAPNPYGAPGVPYGQPMMGGLPQFAHWGQRVGAYLIDYLLAGLAAFPLFIGYAILFATAETTTDPLTGVSTTEVSGSVPAIILILLGVATSIAFMVWNIFIRQGRTGYTIGKGVLGIKLVSFATGQPIGAGTTFVRQIAHLVDSLPCNIGYLWPLWDEKRQTFADKIMNTVVIQQPKG